MKFSECKDYLIRLGYKIENYSDMAYAMNMEASKANEIALKERKDTHNLDDFSTMQNTTLSHEKRQKMKKHQEKNIETREEKEQRWAKQLKQARSFARQNGIKVASSRKQTLSDKFDY